MRSRSTQRMRLLGADIEDLQNLEVGDFGDERLTDEEFDHIFKTCGAMWVHSGNPKAPHAELTSGRCSNGFVDTLRVLSYTNLCFILADQLALKITHTYEDPVDWVIGSDHAAATFSFAVAFALDRARHDFTEKQPDGSQLWKRFTIKPGENVLQVEELITTTKTLERVRKALFLSNPHSIEFAPVVATLVHRSKEYEFAGSPIVYLRHYDIDEWAPEECPLCAQGSKRLKPKHNWDELTRYTAF